MDAQERRKELQRPLLGLAECISALAVARTAEDVVHVIRTCTRELIGADGIAVVRRDGEFCHYIEEDAVTPLWKGQRFPLGTCISGWSMLNAETAVIPDIRTDDRIPQDVYAETFVRSLVMVPVGAENPSGAIGAYWARTDAPGKYEVEVLETLARAAATAMENIRLLEELSRALADAELARDELKHRVKNAYMGAQALAGLTLPREISGPFKERLGSLARVHELLDERLGDGGAIPLRELLAVEVEPYLSHDVTRFEMIGPDVEIEARKAVSVGLAINELATNALKHGSLSVAQGMVSVTWQVEDGIILGEWRESNGPAPSADLSRKSGTGLLERVIRGQLKGKIDLELPASGAVCRFEFPVGLEPSRGIA